MSERVPEVFPPPLPDAPAGPPPRLLTNRPFLWLVGGELLHALALWSFFLASMGEATFRLDATPGQLGLLLAWFSLLFIPANPVFGLLADRWSPKWLHVVASFGTLAALATGLAASSLGWLSVSLGMAGLSHGVVWPARGALVPRLVPASRLVQANGMMSLAIYVPMIVGPAAAGLLVSLWGRDAPYLSGMAAALASVPFLLMVPDRRATRPRSGSTLRDLAVGFREGFRVAELRMLFLLSVGAWLAVGLFITLEPLYVRDVLDLGQDSLGFIWSAHGVGSFAGALALTRLSRGAGREGTLIGLGLLGGGLGLLLYAATASFAAAVVGTVLLGVGWSVYHSPSQALIQRLADDPGRVTSVYGMVAEGGPLSASLGVAVLGAFIVVQPWLIGAGIAMGTFGVLGLRLVRGGVPAPARGEA